MLIALFWEAHHRCGRMKTTMSGKSDRTKGKLKEAAGVLTNDKHLEREGKLDRAAGKIKEKTEEAVDKVKGKVREIVDTMRPMDKD